MGRNRGGTAALLTLAISLASAAAATEVVQLPFGQEKWTGDLDGMIERQKIRVLVVGSRTHYFVDGAVQHGLSYDAVRAFEDELNRAHHAKVSGTLQDADERPLWKRGPPPIRLHPAPEALEDEDLLEMLNAGLVPLVVVDDELAHFGAQVFPEIETRDGLAVHESGEIAWAFRKNSPQLKAVVDAFVVKHAVGTARTNAKLREYLNAGPGRVLQLQKQAAKEGLDPNQWFGNVEKVAARRIGQETVRYVRDIYKYYVAYRLDLELVQEREREKKDGMVVEVDTNESGGQKP